MQKNDAKKVRHGPERSITKWPGGTTIQQDILRIGYILGKKLIERKHSKEKMKGEEKSPQKEKSWRKMTKKGDIQRRNPKKGDILEEKS